MKNRISGMLMETGVSYEKLRLHRMGYFDQLMKSNEGERQHSPAVEAGTGTDRSFDPSGRNAAAHTGAGPAAVRAIGETKDDPRSGTDHGADLAVLEIGDVSRFRSIKQAISYCGLCGEEVRSADKVMRTPISKQRNKHIQHMLVEAARLAPRWPGAGPAV